MAQSVTAPDGTVHNFPDEATPEMIAGALGVKPPTNLGASFEQTPAEKATAVGGPDILPALKSLGKSAVASTLDLAHNTITGAVRGGGALIDDAYSRVGPEIGGSDPGTKLAGTFFNNVLPPYQPESIGGAALQGGVAGAVGGAPFGFVPSLLTAAGGAAGDTLLHLAPDHPGYATAAQIGVPLLLGAPAMLRGNAGSMIARRTEGMTAADWLRAQQFEDAGRGVGFPLAGPESTDNPALWNLGADVAASRSGGPTMGAFFNQRADQQLPPAAMGPPAPGQFRQVMTPLLDQIAPSPASTSDTANRVQRAAEGVVRQTEQARTALTRPFYQSGAADAVDPADHAAIVADIDARLQNAPDAVARPLRALRGDLFDANGQPKLTAGALDDVYKLWRERTELPPTNADNLQKGVAANLPVEDVGRAVTRASPDIAYGRQLYGDLSQNTVGPTRRSEIGQLANRSGIPENSGIQSQISLITNPDTARPDSIRFVANALNSRDPQAFPQIVRTYLDNKFTAAADNLQSGPNRAMGVKFANMVAGSDAERANVRAMLEGVADSYGLPRDALYPGFERALSVLERSGRIPGIGSPTASRGATNAEASASLVDAGNPVGYMKRVWGDVVNRRAYGQLAEAFTAPNSVQAMRELAMTNPDSARAQVLVASMLGWEQNRELQIPGQRQ